MRFHHSTRRGRTRLAAGHASCGSSASAGGAGAGSTSKHSTGASRGSSVRAARWSQLSYCRQSNIHFNRRLPVEPPPPPQSSELSGAREFNESDLASRLGANSNLEILETDLDRSTANNRCTCSSKQDDLCARLNGICIECSKADEECDLCKRQEESAMVATRFNATPAPPLDEDRKRCGCAQKSWMQPQQLRASTRKAEVASGGPIRKEDTNTNKTVEENKSKHATNTQIQASQIDLASARERLLAQVEKHPFWSNKAARRMRLCAPEERRVFLYELVSYCERRELEWRFEPHTGRLTAGSTPFRRPPMGSTLIPPQTSSVSSPSSPPQTPPPISHANLKSHQQQQQQQPFDYGNASLNKSLGHLPSETSTTATPTGSKSPGARLVQQATQSSLSRSNGWEQPTSALIDQTTLPSAELVWSFQVPLKSRPSDFVGSIYTCEVPQTSFVKRCHGCNGRGRLKCNSCYGVGYEVCLSCSGRGSTRSWVNRSSASRYADNSSSSTSAGIGGRSGGSRAPTSLDPSDAGADDEPGAWKRSRDDAAGGISGGDSNYAASPLHSEACLFCHGAGQKRCWTCAGRANLTCTGCAGAGQVRCYLQLSVTWRNHRDELLLNNNDSILPRDRLRLASGLLLIDEIGSPQLKPLDDRRLSATLISSKTGGATSSTMNDSSKTSTKSSALDQSHTAQADANCNTNSQMSIVHTNSKPDTLFQQIDAIQSASARLIERHKTSFKGERLIRQRHKLTQIECFIVKYDWKRRQGHFVIYGDERKVYIAKYPFKSICNIT